MLKNFRAYRLAVEFYRSCEKIRAARHLQNQLQRAASSVALNLAEGSERGSLADQRRFYRMAMGSVRECQAILDLIKSSEDHQKASKLGDDLAANVFNLCRSIDRKLSPQQQQ